MATRINRPAVAVDVPDFPDEGDESEDQEAIAALDDPQKRWLIAGICIHNVISPVLRRFVAPVFQLLYNALVTNDAIDTQAYGNHMTHYPINGGVKLNYECINNNLGIIGGGRHSRFDYTVHDAVDLSRLFLQAHMCFHTGFDHTCDLSALLTFIINVADFDVGQHDCAQQFKDTVRNEWAHCNFSVWTKQKLADSFAVMKDLIQSLQLPPDDETAIMNQLTDWGTNGDSFLAGSTLGLELVNSMMDHVRELRTHMRTLAEQTKDEFNEDFKAFSKIDDTLVEFENEFHSIKETLKHHKESIEQLESRMTTTEERYRDFDDRLCNVEQQNYQRTDKKLYLVPSRIKFVGRENFLHQIEDKLTDTNKTNNKVVLCGLGGIGKTSIVVEYIWKNHEARYPGGIFWISGENGAAFENSVRSLAVVIGTLRSEPVGTHDETFNWISLRQGQCLVVIDNVDEDTISSQIIKLVKQHNDMIGGHNHVIITTRRSSMKAELDFNCSECISVNELSNSESIVLVKSTLGWTSDEYDKDISDLCTELQGLPLAIEQAATYIRRICCTIPDYLKEFKKRRVKLLYNTLSSNVSNIDDINKQSVLTTWTLNIEHIKKRSNEQGLNKAIDLLMPLVSCLARDDITIHMFNEGDPTLKDGELVTIFSSDFMIRRIVYLFTEYSILIENNDGTFRIHSLVQDIIQMHFDFGDSQLHHVGECAIAMLNKAREKAFAQSDKVLLAKLEKQCATLKERFKHLEDIYLVLVTLEVRCFTRTFSDNAQRLREVRERNTTAKRPTKKTTNASTNKSGGGSGDGERVFTQSGVAMSRRLRTKGDDEDPIDRLHIITMVAAAAGSILGLIADKYTDQLSIQNIVTAVHHFSVSSDIHLPCITSADDMVLLSLSKKGLDRLIDICNSYANKWLFEYNALKCAVVVFNESKFEYTQTNRTWFIGSNIIQEEESYTHLGVICDKYLSLSESVKQSSLKLRGCYMSLCNIGMNGRCFHPFTNKKLYNSIVIPKGLFGCEMFYALSHKELLYLERSHRFCLKRMQGIHKLTRTDIVLGILGMLSIECIIDKRKLIFLGQLCHLNPNSKIKQVFLFRLCSYFMNRSNQLGYFPDICTILSSYELEEHLMSYYSSGEFLQYKTWKNIVNRRIDLVFNQSWSYRVLMSNDLDMKMFALIHPAFCESIFWYISKCNYKYTNICRNIIKMISTLGRSYEDILCNKCGIVYRNEMLHCLIHCSSVMEIRHKLCTLIHDKHGERVYEHYALSDDNRKACILLGAPFPELVNLLDVSHIDFITNIIYYIDSMWKSFIA